MEYISTRGQQAPLRFQEAVMTGLARDGGLLLPGRIPWVGDRLHAWQELSYLDLAVEIMRLYADDLPESDLRDLVVRSYAAFDHPEVTPLVEVGAVRVLELFHGPTLSFKDIALQFLGNLFEYILRHAGGELNILAATSGDTGSAAIHGVRSRQRIRIFVMHPHGRVSPLQERQMTTVLDDNVFNLAIDGTFDDCQKIMKTLFADLDFRDHYRLGSVNSINWARLLAQTVYYFHAGLRVLAATGAKAVRFTVPTGNFGDVFAGCLAARMGLPVARLVVATNENDILARFFQTGEYRRGAVHATLSPSMDIQVASNFERYLYYRLGEDPAAVRKVMQEFGATGGFRIEPGADGQVDPLFAAGRGDTAGTLATIRDTYAQHGYLLDPHTAVGLRVAQAHLHPDEPMICLATAHPAKFGAAIAEALGQDRAHHPTLDALVKRPTRCVVLPDAPAAVRKYIETHVPRPHSR